MPYVPVGSHLLIPFHFAFSPESVYRPEIVPLIRGMLKLNNISLKSMV
jgi:hypothetical protein